MSHCNTLLSLLNQLPIHNHFFLNLLFFCARHFVHGPITLLLCLPEQFVWKCLRPQPPPAPHHSPRWVESSSCSPLPVLPPHLYSSPSCTVYDCAKPELRSLAGIGNPLGCGVIWILQILRVIQCSQKIHGCSRCLPFK